MNSKFLPLLLLAILLQVSMVSFADEMITRDKIPLKDKEKVEHRSLPIVPEAFIEDALVSINLLAPAPTATVIIKNVLTGQVVYTSTETNVDALYVDLTGEESGTYTLEVQVRAGAFVGEFELE